MNDVFEKLREILTRIVQAKNNPAEIERAVDQGQQALVKAEQDYQKDAEAKSPAPATKSASSYGNKDKHA